MTNNLPGLVELINRLDLFLGQLEVNTRFDTYDVRYGTRRRSYVLTDSVPKSVNVCRPEYRCRDKRFAETPCEGDLGHGDTLCLGDLFNPILHVHLAKLQRPLPLHDRKKLTF